jgi:hypothetical protein
MTDARACRVNFCLSTPRVDLQSFSPVSLVARLPAANLRTHVYFCSPTPRVDLQSLPSLVARRSMTDAGARLRVYAFACQHHVLICNRTSVMSRVCLQQTRTHSSASLLSNLISACALTSACPLARGSRLDPRDRAVVKRVRPHSLRSCVLQ